MFSGIRGNYVPHYHLGPLYPPSSLIWKRSATLLYRFSKFYLFFKTASWLVSARMWFKLSNATHITRSTSKKLVDAWVTDLGNIYTPQGYQTQIFLMDDIQTTLNILVSVVRSDFRNATDRRSFEARMIFIHRTLPTLRWSLCGLWFHIKSAHAVNVAIFVFISALCCRRIYQFFWNHLWRESTLETFGPHLKF